MRAGTAQASSVSELTSGGEGGGDDDDDGEDVWMDMDAGMAGGGVDAGWCAG